MKLATKYLLFPAFFLFISLSGFAQGEPCKAKETASKLIEGYTFLKNYQIDKTTEEVEYSYVFSNNTTYILAMANKEGNANNVIVEILDSNKKLIASNYNKKTDKYYPAVVFPCKSTGIYYLKFTFKERPDCFASVLGFKK